MGSARKTQNRPRPKRRTRDHGTIFEATKVMITAAAWPGIRYSAVLAEGEVRVWLVDLGRATATGEGLTRVLSEDEWERAARFYFRRDAMRWVMGRAALRAIVGQCLGVAPRAVRFRYGRCGKPELAPPFDRHSLCFNASHSAGLALFAVTGGRRIGVDIERLRPLPDLEAIAERMFSPQEQQALRRLPPAQRHEGFFNCWTRKEAYIKAIGEGLAYPLERFTVSLAPGAPPRLEDVQDDPAEVGRWTLGALEPEPGYAAAVAIEGRPARLVCARWQGRTP